MLGSLFKNRKPINRLLYFNQLIYRKIRTFLKKSRRAVWGKTNRNSTFYLDTGVVYLHFCNRYKVENRVVIMKNAQKTLQEHGISPSFQRIKILEYLMHNPIHPTADMIYQALNGQIPTLSKTTVYNTLKIFTEKGLLAPLSVFENEVRYEYNNQPHIHFKCMRCGRLFDIEASFDCLRDSEIDGHKVTEHHVNLKGICRECRKKEAENNA